MENQNLQKTEKKEINKILIIGFAFSLPILIFCVTLLLGILMSLIPIGLAIYLPFGLLFKLINYKKSTKKKPQKKDLFTETLTIARNEFSKKNFQ